MVNMPRPIKHGTKQGYQQHWNRGEKACDACKKAWRVYYSKNRNTVSRFTWLSLTPEEKQEVIALRKEVKEAKRRIRERSLHPELGTERVGELQAQEPLAVSRGPQEAVYDRGNESRPGDTSTPGA